MLNTENIHCRAGGTAILRGITAVFSPGEFNMIMGPNGSGKSTFLKVFSGEMQCQEGMVSYDGRPLQEWDKKNLARSRAVMSQQPDLLFPLRVEEVVMMGRYPHFALAPGKKDKEICAEVMDQLNLLDFADRNYLTLSGGEKQRVHFARVLAQVWELPGNGCRYLFLDEPLNSLDISYQQEFLQVAASLKKNKTVLVAVMHDINLAAHYGDRLFFLKEGRLAASGRPADILTASLVKEIFNVNAEVVPHPNTKDPMVLFN